MSNAVDEADLQLKKDRRRRAANLWKLVFLVVAVLAYYYGYRVTKIDLKRLVTDIGDVKPIIAALIRPDVVTQEEFSEAARTGFQVPEAVDPPAQMQPSDSEPYFTLSTTSATVGHRLTLEGYNWRANADVEIRWKIVNSRVLIKRTKTDEDGRISTFFSVPQVRDPDTPTIYEVEVTTSWREGPYRASESLKLTVEKMIETIFLALMATTLGILAAVPLSFLGAKNLMGRSRVGLVVYYGVRTVLNILRSIEPLIMGIVFVVWVGLGPFAGVLALGVHSIAALGKLYSESIESIDSGPIEAITATGASRLQTIMYAVVPQVVPPFVSFTIYRWDINVRMSTIIGFVGGGGIGFLLQQWINLLRYREAATAMWAIAFVVATLDYVSSKVREKVV